MSLSTFSARIRTDLSFEATKASNLYKAEMRRSVTTPLPLAAPSSTNQSSATTASSKPAGLSPPSASISETASNVTPPPTASITIAVGISSNELETPMNFAAILTAIQMLDSLLPSIESLVQQAEAIIGTGNGSTKLAYVETSVNAFLEKSVADLDVLSSLKTLLAPTISAIVAAANIKGLFSKTPTSSVAALAVGHAVAEPTAAV